MSFGKVARATHINKCSSKATMETMLHTSWLMGGHVMAKNNNQVRSSCSSSKSSD